MLVITSTTVQTRVIQRTGVKPLVLLGMALGVGGMVLFARSAHLQLRQRRFPGSAHHRRRDGLHLRADVLGRDAGRSENEAGIASAMVNTSQQIGGSVGTSLLSTI